MLFSNRLEFFADLLLHQHTPEVSKTIKRLPTIVLLQLNCQVFCRRISAVFRTVFPWFKRSVFESFAGKAFRCDDFCFEANVLWFIIADHRYAPIAPLANGRFDYGGESNAMIHIAREQFRGILCIRRTSPSELVWSAMKIVYRMLKIDNKLIKSIKAFETKFSRMLDHRAVWCKSRFSRFSIA